jgi:hypothetical protein
MQKAAGLEVVMSKKATIAMLRQPAVEKARGAGKDDSVGGNNGDMLELGDSSRMYPLHHPSAVPSCIVS